MKRDNPFDRLFSTRAWTADEIADFMERLEEETFQPDSRLTVDGDVTIRVFRDGEWHEIGEESEQSNAPIEVDEDGDDYTLTLDVSEYIPYHNFDVSASLNNGILEVSFEKK